MAWTKLDDHFHSNPKIQGVDDGAFRLYVNALNWSVANLTDGYIPTEEVRALARVAHRGAYHRRARALVTAGLWISTEKAGQRGYLIHDFDHYQPTKAQVAQGREAARLRKQKSRAGGVSQRDRRGESHRDQTSGHGVSHATPTRIREELQNSSSLTSHAEGSSAPHAMPPEPDDDDGDGWADRPTDYHPDVWAIATEVTAKQHQAGNPIAHLHQYTRTVYHQLLDASEKRGGEDT